MPSDQDEGLLRPARQNDSGNPSTSSPTMPATTTTTTTTPSPSSSLTTKRRWRPNAVHPDPTTMTTTTTTPPSPQLRIVVPRDNSSESDNGSIHVTIPARTASSGSVMLGVDTPQLQQQALVQKQQSSEVKEQARLRRGRSSSESVPNRVGDHEGGDESGSPSKWRRDSSRMRGLHPHEEWLLEGCSFPSTPTNALLSIRASQLGLRRATPSFSSGHSILPPPSTSTTNPRASRRQSEPLMIKPLSLIHGDIFSLGGGDASVIAELQREGEVNGNERWLRVAREWQMAAKEEWGQAVKSPLSSPEMMLDMTMTSSGMMATAMSTRSHATTRNNMTTTNIDTTTTHPNNNVNNNNSAHTTNPNTLNNTVPGNNTTHTPHNRTHDNNTTSPSHAAHTLTHTHMQTKRTSRASSSSHKQARVSTSVEKLARKYTGNDGTTKDSNHNHTGGGERNSVRQRWHKSVSMIVLANVFILAIRSRRNATMHWATLAFVSPELEKDYRHTVGPSMLRGVHRTFPATLVLLLLNVLCHGASHSSLITHSAAWWGINVGAALLVVMVWGASASRHVRGSFVLTTHGSWLPPFLTILLGVTYMSGWTVTVGGPVWSTQYQKITLIIVLNFVYHLTGLSWTRYVVSVAGLMTFLMYVACASRPHTHADGTGLARTLAYMSASLGLHLFAAWKRERADRMGYLLGKDVKVERHRAQVLLETMLPRKTLRALQSGRTLIADTYVDSTIMFVALEGFAQIVASTPAKRLITFLNGVYSEFDALCDAHGVYKIETVGEVYMCGAGIPDKQEDHAVRVAALALDILEVKTQLQAVLKRKQTAKKAMIPLEVKIGMHSGSVVAGVIGLKKLNYRVFGDTVNTASRMASHGAPGKAHMTKATQQLLEAAGGFEIESRGVIEVKGKGAMETFFLLSDKYAEERLLADNIMADLSPKGNNSNNSITHNQSTLDDNPTVDTKTDNNNNNNNTMSNTGSNKNNSNDNDNNDNEEEDAAEDRQQEFLHRLTMSLPQPHWDPADIAADINSDTDIPKSISPSATLAMSPASPVPSNLATTIQLNLPQPLSTSSSPTGSNTGDKMQLVGWNRWNLWWWTCMPSSVHHFHASITRKPPKGGGTSSMRRSSSARHQHHRHSNHHHVHNHTPPLHPITLNFREKELENSYCNRWNRASLRQMQVVLAVFCATLLPTTAVDILQRRSYSWLLIAFLVRLNYTLIACAGVLLLTLKRRWSQEVMSALSVCGVGVSTLLAVMRLNMRLGECVVMTTVIALQVLMLACALRFIYATFVSSCAILFYVAVVVTLPRHNNGQHEEYPYVDLALIVVELLLLVLAVRETELKSRSWFLLQEELKRQNKISDRLLYDLVPPKIGRLLRRGSRNIVDYYGESTCLFSDIVGFTPLSAQLGALKLVVFLNRLFTDFDNLCDKHKVYKVNTIGDAYVCVAGVPARDPCHAVAGVEMSRGMLRSIAALRAELGWDKVGKEKPALAKFDMRIGLHTGSVIAGVVGTASLRYEVWGSTVQVANKMESSGLAGRVHVSKQCHDFLSDCYDHKYRFEERAEDGTFFLIEERENVVNGYATSRNAVGAALQAGE